MFHTYTTTLSFRGNLFITNRSQHLLSPHFSQPTLSFSVSPSDLNIFRSTLDIRIGDGNIDICRKRYRIFVPLLLSATIEIKTYAHKNRTRKWKEKKIHIQQIRCTANGCRFIEMVCSGIAIRILVALKGLSVFFLFFVYSL